MNKRILKIFILTLLITVIVGTGFAYMLSHFQGSFKTDVAVTEENTDSINTDEDSDKGGQNGSEIVPEIEYVPVVEPIPTPTPEPFEEYDINLLAVGDNLMHLGLVNSGRQADGTLNYDFLFESILPYLDKSDISIINQETVMAGNEKGFSGFPYFNSPVEIADAIDKAGFNVVLQASNHTIDQGMDGLYNVCTLWSEHPDITMVGIHENAEDARDIPIMEVKGFKFAILNYTYGPNLGAVPAEVNGHLNILCKIKDGSKTGELDLTSLNPEVTEDIKRAKEIADIVIVCPHWGTEYATEPSSYQRKFASEMCEAGADVIIGAHPHAPEPVEWIESPSGNKTLCYYSLGNYVSTGQQGQSMLEGMAWVVFHVTEDGIEIDNNKTGVLPLVMQYLSGPLRFEGVYALEDYTDELASHHGIRSWGGVNLTVDQLTKWKEEIFGEFSLSKDYILNQ